MWVKKLLSRFSLHELIVVDVDNKIFLRGVSPFSQGVAACPKTGSVPSRSGKRMCEMSYKERGCTFVSGIDFFLLRLSKGICGPLN